MNHNKAANERSLWDMSIVCKEILLICWIKSAFNIQKIELWTLRSSVSVCVCASSSNRNAIRNVCRNVHETYDDEDWRWRWICEII